MKRKECVHFGISPETIVPIFFIVYLDLRELKQQFNL